MAGLASVVQFSIARQLGHSDKAATIKSNVVDWTKRAIAIEDRHLALSRSSEIDEATECDDFEH